MPSIVSFGRYLPAAVLRNDELAARLQVDAAWISGVSGIEERRIALPGETVADMAFEAGRDCLSRACLSHTSAKPGLILVASGSSERRFPGPAAEVAHRLGFAGTPAIDLALASAGSLFGIVLGAQLAPQYGPVLLIASEKMSAPAVTEPLDKNIAILFGDGAGACLIQPGGPGLEIADSVLHSDGAWANDLQLGLTGPIHMNGPTVIMQAARKIPAAISELLKRNAVAPDAIAQFVMHQANQNLIDRVARALQVPAARFYSNIQKYGNTSSASLLIAASEWHEQPALKAGDRICLAAFGAGFHWGAALLTAAF
jgi:3-oxoacyl-[acyl-carrier-protein] synthase-3